MIQKSKKSDDGQGITIYYNSFKSLLDKMFFGRLLKALDGFMTENRK